MAMAGTRISNIRNIIILDVGNRYRTSEIELDVQQILDKLVSSCLKQRLIAQQKNLI